MSFIGRLFKGIVLIMIGLLCSHQVFSQHEEKKFDAGEMILHHIADSHEWHLFDINETHVTIPLPIIVYSEKAGLDIFSSAEFHHGRHQEILNEKGEKVHTSVLERPKATYIMSHEHITLADGSHVYDFSITKNVMSMLVSVVLLLTIFPAIARSYKKRGANSAPKGIQSIFEPIIVFIRDEIAKPNIGPSYERFMPYLLTVFFFIWFNNMLGLFPAGANLTGNIAITAVLALLTLLITLFSSKKYHWQHIFATPGVPVWLYPIMIPVEVIGIFTKPFSLMIRLFANITAGHIIILSLLSLIFLFRSYAMAPVSVAFAAVMNILELFVAILQAYVFTLLSAMYFGSAVEEHHHEEGHAESVHH